MSHPATSPSHHLTKPRHHHRPQGVPSFMSQKPRVVGSQEVGSTRWLRLSTLTYTDRRGQPRAWDVATRTTTKEGAGADAVGILVVLKGETAADHQIVLVKQVHGQQG